MVHWVQYHWSATLSMCCGVRTAETCDC